ncbi:MAG: lasso peptide biosynthesis protein [Bacteroidetes bacterium]|nr:lasso peptide biosynthesis protein [Bacteroidota bacterium]
MKLKSFLPLAILFAFSSSVFSQKYYILERSIVIDNVPFQAINKPCNYYLLLPKDFHAKQDVISYDYSVKPTSLYGAKNENFYAKWENIIYSEFKEKKLTAKMKIKTTKYDLATARLKPQLDPEDLDTNNYLKDEANLKISTKAISETAQKITGTSREELVKNIYNFVCDTLSYKNFVIEKRSAKKALTQGAGDCTEYSELMVSLCRAKNIPARLVVGLVLKAKYEAEYHNWVEVFFPQYGWVAFDPTWGDSKVSGTTYEKMRNIYVKSSSTRDVGGVLRSECFQKDLDFKVKVIDTYTFGNQDLYVKKDSLYQDSVNITNNATKALKILDTLLSLEPDNYAFAMRKGICLARLQSFDEAFKYIEKANILTEIPSEKRNVLYAYANYYALKNDATNAVLYLYKSFDNGFSGFNRSFLKDADFEKIKDNAEFIEFRKKIQEKVDAADAQKLKKKG